MGGWKTSYWSTDKFLLIIFCLVEICKQKIPFIGLYFIQCYYLLYYCYYGFITRVFSRKKKSKTYILLVITVVVGCWHYFYVYNLFPLCHLLFIVANVYIPLYLFHHCEDKIGWVWKHILTTFSFQQLLFFSLPIIAQFYYSFIYISQLTTFSWGQKTAFSELVPLEYRSKSKA